MLGMEVKKKLGIQESRSINGSVSESGENEPSTGKEGSHNRPDHRRPGSKDTEDRTERAQSHIPNTHTHKHTQLGRRWGERRDEKARNGETGKLWSKT